MAHPTHIGKYELREFLGGGMSHVFKAWDPVMDRTVAVKILTDEGAADAETKARFLREARTAGGLSHDNVIRVYDFGEEAGRTFMVMEFLDGEDLRQAIKSGRAGNLPRRLEIALEAARALEYIHGQNIVHRDIKPENIHLDLNGRVRLMDFGIAKRPDLSLTRPGFALGTPYYMAPEQVRGEDVNHLADIYSFGVLLFELCGGGKPFQEGDINRLFYRILNDPPDLTPLRESGAPDNVCDLVERCMAKLPRDRPQSFGEVCEQLAGTGAAPAPRQATVAVTAAPPLTVPDEVRREETVTTDGGQGIPKWLIPAVVLAGLAIVVVIVLMTRTPPEPEVVKDEPAEDVAPPEPVPLAATLDTPTGLMVLVPAGEFQFGENGTAALDAYYIDKTEVTNAAYRQFCEAAGHPLPPSFPSSKPDLPVVNVTFNDAKDYASWAGKRLPTPEEWERAARGVDGREYPWGNEKLPSRANVAGSGGAGLMPANGFPDGASPVGALHMAGNVWEWIDGPVTPSDGAVRSFKDILTPPATAGEPWYTMRGSSFRAPLIDHLTWEWVAVPARFRDEDIGFRCVK